MARDLKSCQFYHSFQGVQELADNKVSSDTMMIIWSVGVAEVVTFQGSSNFPFHILGMVIIIILEALKFYN